VRKQCGKGSIGDGTQEKKEKPAVVKRPLDNEANLHREARKAARITGTVTKP